MVNYGEAHLDRVFAALSDPTRRAVLSRLARNRPLSVTALAEPFDLKLHSVMKHLDVNGRTARMGTCGYLVWQGIVRELFTAC